MVEYLYFSMSQFKIPPLCFIFCLVPDFVFMFIVFFFLRQTLY